ncbi:MAG: phosphotransferase [Alphaproteobacteria bacterium]|nr:phosphotransferase [Alphaproteobacteria bacterium]
MSESAPSRQEQFSGTKDVVERLRFDEARLEAYLAKAIPDFKGPLTVEQFKGGQSNPTYRLTTPGRRYVLRRKPPGKLLPSAHQVEREYNAIAALHPTGFPVAKPYLLCEDDSVIGTTFYVMECVEGRIIWEPTIPGITREHRAAIYDAMNATLARLHMLDYQKIGLTEFGRPGNYFARQISRWSKQYVASVTETIEAMDKLMAWLPEHIPADDSVSIVHGDYRLDNMILHPYEPRVLAVLDWEISTIGHPLADFTYHLMQWRMPPGGSGGGTGSLMEADLSALGIPSEQDYIALYCERTGRKGIDHLDYYYAYNFFRIAGILQGIVGRVRDGTAANAHAATMAANVRPLAELGWDYAKRAGAK